MSKVNIQTVIEIARELAMKTRGKKEETIKVCSCGVKYYYIPGTAKHWDYEPRKLWLWECSCKTHLVWPADKATALAMDKDLMPTEAEFNAALEGFSDRYKAFREKELLEQDHNDWWERNKPEKD